MPIVTIEGPPLDVERKRELVGDITDALERVYGLPREVFVVIIRENPGENVGVGGSLLCDRHQRPPA